MTEHWKLFVRRLTVSLTRERGRYLDGRAAPTWACGPGRELLGLAEGAGQFPGRVACAAHCRRDRDIHSWRGQPIQPATTSPINAGDVIAGSTSSSN